jgi:DNA polymerase V
MYTYIKNGVKKLSENSAEPNKATIFLCGNVHKGEKHYSSKQISFNRQTKDADEIWSQVYPHMKKLFQTGKKYKKCGIIFNELMPDSQRQTSLFEQTIQIIQPPVNKEKKWEMKQDFITRKYTTSWDEIPEVFV